MRIRAIATAVSAAWLAGACTVGPNFEKPASYPPTSWFGGVRKVSMTAPHESEPVAAPIDPHWWSQFHDPELASLEDRVAAGNLDVRVATLRLAESRSQRGIVAADQYPSANGNASYTREQISNRGVVGLFGGAGTTTTGNTTANGLGGRFGAIPTQTQGSTTPKIRPFDLWQYGFDASWELDLWGRVRRSVESADASVDASAEARRDTLLSSLAEVARDYVQLRGTQTMEQIAEDNLKTAKQSLQLARDRASGGLGTDLDVANAAAQVQTNAAQIPQLQQQEASLINALSLLVGLQPDGLRGELATAKPIPPVPPTVPVGLPSELARRRPDIRQAEAQLHAATANIGVAVADFYPTITLSGSAGFQALQLSTLGAWNAGQYAFGPSITLPIFQGGRLHATLELRRAQEKEAAVTYQKTVLSAWHEIDNALTAYQAEQARRALLAQSVVENRRAVGLAQSRYQQGLSDFLNVLDAERSLLAAEQQEADSTTIVSTNLVALYKALGGGWESEYPDQPMPQQVQAAPASAAETAAR